MPDSQPVSQSETSPDEIRLRGQLQLRQTTIEDHDDVQIEHGGRWWGSPERVAVSLDHVIREHFGEGYRLGLATVTYGEVEVVIRRVRDE